MILFLGIPLLAFVLTLISALRSGHIDKAGCVLMSFMTGTIFLFLMMIINCVFVPEDTNSYYMTQQKYDLIPIYEQNYTIITAEDTAIFIYKNPNGEEIKINDSEDLVKIHYTTGEPYVVKHTYCDFKYKFLDWLFINVVKDTSYWDIYVPTNSVFYIS